MKLIKPAEISAKIMTLIDDAEKELIIVSPYNNITGWTKLINRIKKVQSKGIDISWYSRKNNVNDDNTEEVKKNLGITPILVDDLHAKIYMNETYAVVTSMNMSKISDDKSIDIGYLTETLDEYQELTGVFNRYIKVSDLPNKEGIKQSPIPDKKSNKRFQQIVSSYRYVKLIHTHLNNKYGSFHYNYKADVLLEYTDFVYPILNIQFIPYSSAIKIQIEFRSDKQVENICKSIYKDKSYNQLHKPNEFECYPNDSGLIVKYYYKGIKDPTTWSEDSLCKFIRNLDILINLVLSNY